MKTKKTLLLLALTLFSLTAGSQTKKELLLEIDYLKKEAFSKPFTISYDELWDALYSVGLSEYPEVTKESKSRGFIEFKTESDTYKEIMIADILGEEGRLRVSFQVQKYSKINSSQWSSAGSVSEKYINKLKAKLSKESGTDPEIPEELALKIEKYNSTQDATRKKIIAGRDY